MLNQDKVLPDFAVLDIIPELCNAHRECVGSSKADAVRYNLAIGRLGCQSEAEPGIRPCSGTAVKQE